MTNVYQIKNVYGYYFFVQELVDFDNAVARSEELGGKLVEFETHAEYEALWNAISSNILPEIQILLDQSLAPDGGFASYAWIGGTDVDTISSSSSDDWNWQWLTSAIGISKSREEWGSGILGREPDDFQNIQHRLGLGLSGWPSSSPGGYGNAGEWNDLNSQNYLWYIAEIPRIFNVNFSKKYVAEGEYFFTTIETIGVIEGAQIFWKITGDGIDSADFSLGNLNGVGVVDSQGKFTLLHQLAANYDALDEIFEIQLYADELYEQPLFSADKIVIKDSLNPILNDFESNNSDEEFVNTLYQNVHGSLPDSNTLGIWVNKLVNAEETRETTVSSFENLPDYQNRILKDVRSTDLLLGRGIPTKNNHEVSVKYRGTLENGFEFDSGIITFTLGENKVIEGWEKGIPGMRVGDKRYIVIPPELGYGDIALSEIPANSTLIFETELLEIKSYKFDGAFKDYSFYKEGDKYKIKSDKSEDLFDEITGISNLEFTDETINVNEHIIATFDLVNGFEDESAQMFRLYNAAFSRFPDSSGLAYWIKNYSSGIDDIRAVASSFLISDEFVKTYGNDVSDEEYVELLYENVLNRDLDTDGYQYWVGNLNNGIETRYEVLIGFSESEENKTIFSEMTGFY